MSEERIRLLDVDSHIVEPVDLFEGEYMDPAYRGAAPFKIVDRTDAAGRRISVLYEGSTLMMEDAGLSAAAGVPMEKLMKGITYTEANSGGWDAAKRLADMDLADVDHSVLNPSTPGLRVGFVEDPGLAAAMCRAWTDFTADHCAAGKGRFSANMILPWQDVDLALAELERASAQECFRGVIMRPAPEYANGFLGDPVFDPVFSAIAERGLCLILHSCAPREGIGGPIVSHYQKAGRPYWHATMYGIMLNFPFEAWAAWAQLVFEGVLDKHPTLKVMLTESHGGWLVTALERMDEYAKGGEALRAAYQMRLELLPSEYFARQGFIIFEGDEETMAYSAEHIGDSMLWALDYPHADCSFPDGPRDFRENLKKLPAWVQRAVAWENGARAYSMDGTE